MRDKSSIPSRMRLIPFALCLTLCLLQVPLWFAKGGRLDAIEMQRRVALSQLANKSLEHQNLALQRQVDDLRNGTRLIEESARANLDMLQRGEIFIQVINPDSAPLNVVPTH